MSIRDISKYSYQSILSCDVFSVRIQWKLFLYVWSYRLGWVEISTWRRWTGLVYQRATGDPPFLMQDECDTSPFNHQSSLMADHFMGTANIVWNSDFWIFWTTGAFNFSCKCRLFSDCLCWMSSACLAKKNGRKFFHQNQVYYNSNSIKVLYIT